MGKKEIFFSSVTQNHVTANVSAQYKTSASQSGQNGQASTIVSTFYGLTTKEHYCRLIVIALHIALNERPLSNFPDLINLQKKNGLTFLEGRSHEKACAEFIDLLPDIIRSDTKNILSSFCFCFFSIAMDLKHGREALKTLLYSKVVVRGQSVELLLECTYMDEYGRDSKSSKRASDDVCSIIFQKI